MTKIKSIARLLEPGGERPFLPSLLRTARFRAQTGAQDALVGKRFRVLNYGKMTFPKGARLRLGTGFYGFMDGSEPALIRNRGILNMAGDISIGAAARWDIGPAATVNIGEGTYFSPHVLLVATERIDIGDGCAIGWDVQLLDADFHSHGITPNLSTLPPANVFRVPIEIGDRVWVGSGVKIYKGVSIADGCIIAGGSVVTRSVKEPGSLIAGNPSRVVKTNVKWR